MKLLSTELIARFAVVGCQDGIQNPLVIARFFNPCGTAVWYATEYIPEQNICFGYVTGLVPGGDEWGYFSIHELEELICPPFDLPIERDISFTETYFSNLNLKKHAHKR